MSLRSSLRMVSKRTFWIHVFDRDGDGEHQEIVRPVLITFIYSLLIWLVDWATPADIDLGIEVAPYEFAGAILGALLVLRTNSGLERWYEGRKLWGGIVNQSRNLGVILMANGPRDREWQRQAIGWVAAFSHACRRSLRRQKNMSEIEELIGADEVAWLATVEHRPVAVALRIERILADARDRGLITPETFMKANEQRSLLVDYIGACERILKTPLAPAYVVLIRRFIVLFLATLPFALLRRVEWLTPFVTTLVAYPILALDQISDDLQRPFLMHTINHLPLNDITTNIESNLLDLLKIEEKLEGPTA